MNGILAFTANDGVNGYEPWKSDGTVSGTVMVKDINPGSAGSFNPMADWPPVVNVNGVPFLSRTTEPTVRNCGRVRVPERHPDGEDINPGLTGSGIEGIVAPIAGTTTAIIGGNDGTHGTGTVAQRRHDRRHLYGGRHQCRIRIQLPHGACMEDRDANLALLRRRRHARSRALGVDATMRLRRPDLLPT